MTDKEKLQIAIDALIKIHNTPKWLLEDAKKQGVNFDPKQAVELSKDSGWLKSVAREALRKIEE